MKRNYLKYIEKQEEPIKSALYGLATHLKTLETKRGVMSDTTIYQNVSIVNFFLSNYSLTLQGFEQYISQLKRKKQFVYTIKRSLPFIQQEMFLDQSVYDQINNYKVIEPKILHMQDKKFSIPFERWKECYNYPVIKKRNNRRLAVFLGLNMGLRVGELVHLKKSNLNLDENYLLIQADPNKNWQPKTVSSFRRLYISPFVKRILTEYLNKKNLKESDYLIGVTENAVYRWVSEMTLPFTEQGKTVNRSLHPHVLRYSFAVHYYFKTKDLYSVSIYLGHADIQTTENYLGLTEQQRFDRMKTLFE
jgi:integrase